MEAGEIDRALPLFKKAVESGLRDDLLFRTLWDIARLECKQDRHEEALAIWMDLAASRNPYRVKAFSELAKHAEHAEKNYAKALDFTCSALSFERTVDLEKREQRLRKKLTPRRKTRT
jgi:tetratricopeptide (TPR) repeat protein